MTSPHALRPATVQDAREMACLTQALGYAARAAQIQAHLEALLRDARYAVVVAPGPDGHLLGWLVAERRLTLESGPSIEITGLVVSATARRLGVGSALVAAAEAWARQQGFRVLRVRSNQSRAESHPFYQGIGFQRLKTQHVYEKSLA